MSSVNLPCIAGFAGAALTNLGLRNFYQHFSSTDSAQKKTFLRNGALQLAAAVAAYAVNTQTAKLAGADLIIRNLQIFALTSAIIPALSVGYNLAIHVKNMASNTSVKAERRAFYKEGLRTFALVYATITGLELTTHSAADVATKTAERMLRVAHEGGFLMAATLGIYGAYRIYSGLDKEDLKTQNYYLKEGLSAMAIGGICLTAALGASSLRS